MQKIIIIFRTFSIPLGNACFLSNSQMNLTNKANGRMGVESNCAFTQLGLLVCPWIKVIRNSRTSTSCLRCSPNWFSNERIQSDANYRTKGDDVYNLDLLINFYEYTSIFVALLNPFLTKRSQLYVI